MDKKQSNLISRIEFIEKKIDSIENKIDKLISMLEEDVVTTVPKKKTSKRKPQDKKIIKKGSCQLSVFRDALLIGGNTFDRKELIKSLGGRWNPDHKGWTVSAERLDHVKNELEKYFESVSYNDKSSKKNLISKNVDDNSDNVSFSSGGMCDIDSDSD